MRILALVLVVVPLLATADEIPQPGPDAAWSTYDFVVGDKVLLFEEFTSPDKKTSPLKRYKSVTERLAVVDRNGAKWLHCRPPCAFDVVLPENLPERFTVDFDLASGPGSNGLTISAVKPDGGRFDTPVNASSSHSTVSLDNGGDEGRSSEIDRIEGLDVSGNLHFAWSFDGAKVRAYADHFAALNVTNLKMERTNRLHFEFIGGDDPTLIDQNVPVFLTNLRIAGGGNAITFAEFSKKGRLALPGILFDTGSDRIRPESTPTLAAVATLLAGHPTLKLVVEGHTDNQGAAPANLTLSQKRAAAVKTWLVTRHKVDASRLDPQGFGQAKPVATNDTSEGRQANRRVEISQP